MGMNISQEDYSRNILEDLEFCNITNLEDCMSCDELFRHHNILSANWFQGIIYFLYSTVFVVALTGNGLVCYVVSSIPKMKTVTNFFIVNLALGDILMAVFCVPTSFVSTLLLQHWPFGEELCPSLNYLQAVSVLVSAYTLVAISIDRYIAIMWPLKPKLSKRQAKFLILAVWLLALVISLPIAILSRLSQPSKRYEKCNKYICDEMWPIVNGRYYFSIALLVLQYLIPIMTLMFTYTSIAIMVWGKRPPGEAENVRDQRMARSKRKMVKMMMTVVVVFTICWLPYNILILVNDHNERLKKWSGMPFIWMALHWLAMSHSCYNPVIYCWMNVRFRAGFVSAISRVPGIRRVLRNETRSNHNTGMGMPLTGLDGSGQSVLRRTNTYTTYVSVPRKMNGSRNASTRSASTRSNEHFRYSKQQAQRQLTCFESHSEEQI